MRAADQAARGRIQVWDFGQIPAGRAAKTSSVSNHGHDLADRGRLPRAVPLFTRRRKTDRVQRRPAGPRSSRAQALILVVSRGRLAKPVQRSGHTARRVPGEACSPSAAGLLRQRCSSLSTGAFSQARRRHGVEAG
jgi:hypothetical protein